MGTSLAVVAGVGVAAQVVGGIVSAQAQGRAAEAEAAQAREERVLATAAAEPSPEELAQLQSAIDLNQQDIDRKQALLDSSDPALIESGKQALQLLQGEEAKTLEPIRRQREEDRLRLEERLRSQLGSGFATSSAGSQAINDFDAETGSLLAVEQDRSLGRLLGVAQSVSAQGLTSNIAAAGGLAQLFGNIQQRRVSAITGTSLTPFAGAPFVGQAQFGQILGGLGSAAVQGATLGAVLGRFGPTTPTTATPVPGTGTNLPVAI